MRTFIQNNITWLIPVITILLTIMIKISAKPDKSGLKKEDWIDFGFDMTITSMAIIMANAKDEIGMYLFVAELMLVMGATILVRKIGWDNNNNCPNWLGIIVPDIIGILSLVLSTLFVRGIIK